MFKRKKKFLAYFVTLLLPFIILFFPQNYFEPLKMQVVDILALPVRIVLFPFEEAQKVFLYRVTYNRYVKLKKETDLLKSKIISQEGLLEENRRLKALLDFKANSSYPVITANVIGRDPSNWHATVIIDKGQKDGVKQGMPVADASNVIGKISEAGKYVSKVMLLSDPNFSVAALLERSRESGLITGSLQGACRMRYLSPEADIRVGDKVITSQLSTSFPEGFLIGEVTAIEESPGSPTIECLVLPAAHLSQIEEVLIIKK